MPTHSHPNAILAFERNVQVNKGVDSSILLRDVVNGTVVESHIPLYSPLVKAIEVGGWGLVHTCTALLILKLGSELFLTYLGWGGGSLFFKGSASCSYNSRTIQLFFWTVL